MPVEGSLGRRHWVGLRVHWVGGRVEGPLGRRQGPLKKRRGSTCTELGGKASALFVLEPMPKSSNGVGRSKYRISKIDRNSAQFENICVRDRELWIRDRDSWVGLGYRPLPTE